MAKFPEVNWSNVRTTPVVATTAIAGLLGVWLWARRKRSVVTQVIPDAVPAGRRSDEITLIGEHRISHHSGLCTSLSWRLLASSIRNARKEDADFAFEVMETGFHTGCKQATVRGFKITSKRGLQCVALASLKRQSADTIPTHVLICSKWLHAY